jgi:hypothetical protein
MAWRVTAANPRSKLLAHADARIRFRMRGILGAELAHPGV